MRRRALALNLAFAAIAVASSWFLLTRPALATPQVGAMSVREVSEALAAGSVVLFDANSPRTYAQGHLPGARNVDYEDLSADELPADKATRVVFYCKSRL